MLSQNDTHLEEYVVQEVTSGMEGIPHEFLNEETQSGEEYGGMDHALYDSIVDFKRYGRYPAFLSRSMDRSGNCHWRMKCGRFVLSTDNETLLYFNQQSAVNDVPKVVVKKGEVRRVIERIHDMIGHLGMKRTQFSVMRKMYWRSVRADVRNFVNSCDFCMQKKVDGKKIMKAPIDITSDDFDLTVVARSAAEIEETGGERLVISLKGIDEDAVRMEAMRRMTSYTFRETAPESRNPMSKPSMSFKRQPYVKRSRFSQNSTGYLVPYNAAEFGKKEPAFVEMFHVREELGELLHHDEQVYDETMVIEDGLVEAQPGEVIEEVVTEVDEHDERLFRKAGVHEHLLVPERWSRYASEMHQSDEPSTSGRVMQQEAERMGKVKTEIRDPDDHVEDRRVGREVMLARRPKLPNRHATPLKKLKGGRFSTNVNGAGCRFANVLSAPEKLISDAGELVNSYEDAQRGELCPLAPIMFMPSSDPDVVMLQKELLERQRKIQLLQAQVLQSQLDMVRMEGGGSVSRYGDHHLITRPRSVRETMEDEELNVMDGEDNEEKLIRFG